MNVRERTVGGLLVLALIAVLCGGLGPWTPDGWPVSPLVRFLDNLAPWMLALAGLCALAMIALGARRAGLAGLVLALAGAGGIGATHLRLSLPRVGGAGELQVMFFNVLATNTANAGAIAQMVIDRDPDIVIFTEFAGVRPASAALRAHYAFEAECPARETLCDMAVFSHLQPRRYRMQTLGAFLRVRFFRGEFDWQGRSFVIDGAHLLKPWFSGYADVERNVLRRQTKDASLPELMMGDFNAGAWNGALAAFLDRSGFRAERRPVATWPPAAGGLGLPLDHALVRGGMRLISLEPVGAGLGSNHRGLLATLRIGD